MDPYAKARDLGIETQYIDGQGHRRVTDVAALQVILDSLPPQALHRLVVQPVVVRSGRSGRTDLASTAKLPVSWTIEAEGAVLASGKTVERAVVWPQDLPRGVHRLKLTDAAAVIDEVPLIVAPEKAYGGGLDLCWLLAIQLYSIRSARNWGMGDFTDLRGLIELAHRLGADGVGLNPLHALFDDHPGDCSPYSPNSRLFLNALYIDVEGLPEFRADKQAKKTLAVLRAGDVVDYPAVAALKWRALRAAYDTFKSTPSIERRQDFERFRAERGTLLSRFACFEVLRHKYTAPWWEWPEEWRQPDDGRCARLRKGPDASDIEFVEFVQWNAERQLGACADHAEQLGMKVGLYLDVAVGVQPNGFDAWNEQVAISHHLGVGAPPDPLNTAGQDWGLAGFNSAGLELRSFEPFRQMLRASMRHAGAIRLDHVLGLKRLYMVPRGYGPENGAYVQMPFEALLAVTAMESVTQRCIVIGEDLGTVPEGFRAEIADWGIWSYLVMMFERDDNGAFKDMDQYAGNALVTFNTHDLSTYAGWRSFFDLKLKRSIGIDPGESDEARWHALGMLDQALRQQGIDGHDFCSVAGCLSRTKSRLLALSLEDLLGVLDQPNIPGTVNEHPNWRRRLPVSLEQLMSAIDVEGLRAATRARSQPNRAG